MNYITYYNDKKVKVNLLFRGWATRGILHNLYFKTRLPSYKIISIISFFFIITYTLLIFGP